MGKGGIYNFPSRSFRIQGRVWGRFVIPPDPLGIYSVDSFIFRFFDFLFSTVFVFFDFLLFLDFCVLYIVFVFFDFLMFLSFSYFLLFLGFCVLYIVFVFL